MFQMSRRGGGGRGRKEKKKDVWDVEGGYMGMKKQKLEEQFKEQVCLTFTVKSSLYLKMIFRQIKRSRQVGSLQELQSSSTGAQIHLLRNSSV